MSMKKFLVSLLTLLPVVASAYDEKVEGIFYDFTESGATVTFGNVAYADTIKIPQAVKDSLGTTYNVTAIGQKAFFGCSGLKSVEISANIQSIGSYAFSGCSGLKEINLPQSLDSIADYAFYSCKGLTEIVVPANVKTLGSKVFASCSALQNVTIPGSVVSFGSETPFADCPNIAALNVDCQEIPGWFTDMASLKTLTLGDNVKTIGQKAFYGCSGLTSVVLPEGVESIGGFAFAGCRNLTSVNIPASVKEVGNDAFYGCSALSAVSVNSEEVAGWLSGMKSLKTLTLGENVKAIGEGAFDGCSGLTSVNLPAGVTAIGKKAFQNCTGLTEAAFAEGLTSIGDYAFYGCSKLAKADLPESVESIGGFAFCGCWALTDVAISANVKEIGSYAFYACSKIASVSVNSEEVGNWFSGLKSLETVTLGENVKAIGDGAFDGCTGLTSFNLPAAVTTIGQKAFQNCAGLTEVNLPEGLTTIGDYAFYGCTGLTEITIPESVESIGNYAFYRCDNLTTVTVGMPTPVEIGVLTFGNRSKATLYVPQGSKAAYQAASYWSDFSQIKVVEGTDNVLYVKDMEATGKRVVFPVALKNMSAITGLQMDLYLPEGMTLATDSDGKVEVSVVSARMAEEYTLSCKAQEGGFIRIVGFSANSDSFTGNDGDILNLTLNIEGLAEGEYKVQLKDIVLSDVNNTEFHSADIEATISVKVYAKGDVDGNGEVNINDVVSLVNHAILNQETGTYIVSAADMNDDGEVNITDAIGIVNLILGIEEENADNGDEPQPESRRMKARQTSTEDYLYLNDFDLKRGETAEVAVRLSNTHGVRGTQGNIRLPEGFSFVTKSNGRPDVKNAGERSEGFTLMCALQPDGSMTFAQFSLDGSTIEAGDDAIFTFKVTSDANVAMGNHGLSLTDVVLSIDGQSYGQPDFYGSVIATAIEGVNASETVVGECYDLQGRKLSAPAKGLNIIVGADGTAKKVMRK